MASLSTVFTVAAIDALEIESLQERAGRLLALRQRK